MHQNIEWIRAKVCRTKILTSTSAAFVPQFVSFSCSMGDATKLNEAVTRQLRNGKQMTIFEMSTWGEWIILTRSLIIIVLWILITGF